MDFHIDSSNTFYLHKANSVKASKTYDVLFAMILNNQAPVKVLGPIAQFCPNYDGEAFTLSFSQAYETTQEAIEDMKVKPLAHRMMELLLSPENTILLPNETEINRIGFSILLREIPAIPVAE